jgi:preprotein translocase subunit YajC
MLLPLLMLVPILFMSMRRQKKESDARAKLRKGDRIVTNGGLVGELVEMDERFAKVKVAPGTTLTVLSSTVGPLEGNPDAKTAAPDAKVATAEKK